MCCQLRSSRARRFVIVGVALMCLFALPALAEEKESEAELEAEQAAKEDEADRAKGEGFDAEQPYDGRLVLGQVTE